MSRAFVRSLWIVTLLALAGCVTNDPFQPPKESKALTTLRSLEGRCRDWVQGQLENQSRWQEAYSYFGKLPRESAKTYVVFVPKNGGLSRVAVCDSKTGKADAVTIGESSGPRFAADFARRERKILAPQRESLGPSELSNAVVSAVYVKADGKLKRRDYWVPRHVEMELNDLFFDATGS